MQNSGTLRQYLKDNYEKSIFDEALNDPSPWVYHLHGRDIIQARMVANSPYQVVLSADGETEQEIDKINKQWGRMGIIG